MHSHGIAVNPRRSIKVIGRVWLYFIAGQYLADLGTDQLGEALIVAAWPCSRATSTMVKPVSLACHEAKEVAVGSGSYQG
jgi:hypothetical protein